MASVSKLHANLTFDLILDSVCARLEAPRAMDTDTQGSQREGTSWVMCDQDW